MQKRTLAVRQTWGEAALFTTAGHLLAASINTGDLRELTEIVRHVLLEVVSAFSAKYMYPTT